MVSVTVSWSSGLNISSDLVSAAHWSCIYKIKQGEMWNIAKKLFEESRHT